MSIDSKFLRDKGIMDYSVLLGIEEITKKATIPDRNNLSFSSGKLLSTKKLGFSRTVSLLRAPSTSVRGLKRFDRHRFQSAVSNSDGDKFIYHISIIDYLQNWTYKKRAENFLKSTFMNKDSQRLSAVEPIWYQERFMEFMVKQVCTVAESLRISRPDYIKTYGPIKKRERAITHKEAKILKRIESQITA